MRGLRRGVAVASLGLASILYAGDGSDERGYVPPPINSRQIAPPPANMSGGESFIPYPPPPAAPMSRSEKKNPPRPPTIFTWAVGNQPDALATPRTLDSLLKVMKRDINADYACEVKGLDEISSNPDENPVVYFTTHYNFEFSSKQRETLRDFMLRGGTLILNPGRGSKPAYDSAIRELGLIIPQGSIQQLSPDNPIFHSYYDLDKIDAFWGEQGRKTIEPRVSGLTIDCRIAGIVPRLGIDSCAEEIREGIDVVPVPEDAQKLGINILSYATAMRAWQESAKNKIILQDKQNISRAGSLTIAQLKYDGEWKTRHAALPILLSQFNQASGIPVKYNYEEIGITDKKLFDNPVVFMTGHESFTLTDAERKNLRDYLASGGMLIAESCCGRRGFDFSFRKEMNSLFSGESLEEIASSSAIYKMPNKIGQMKVTPALASHLKSPTANPRLMRLNHDGKDAVIYSPLGLQGGWELSQSPFAHGYSDSDSLKLGVNILLYSATR